MFINRILIWHFYDPLKFQKPPFLETKWIDDPCHILFCVSHILWSSRWATMCILYMHACAPAKKEEKRLKWKEKLITKLKHNNPCDGCSKSAPPPPPPQKKLIIPKELLSIVLHRTYISRNTRGLLADSIRWWAR